MHALTSRPKRRCKRDIPESRSRLHDPREIGNINRSFFGLHRILAGSCQKTINRPQRIASRIFEARTQIPGGNIGVGEKVSGEIQAIV